MSKKWYGSLDNRLEENKMYCEEIKVGTGMTEYSYSDRKAYEVVKVINQNNVLVRELDHKAVGEPMSNEWELISNPNNPVRELKKRYGSWNWVAKVTKENIQRPPFVDKKIYDEVVQKGSAIIYYKANVSFGVAEYYYDYEF